jgi:hypothetical protein
MTSVRKKKRQKHFACYAGSVRFVPAVSYGTPTGVRISKSWNRLWRTVWLLKMTPTTNPIFFHNAALYPETCSSKWGGVSLSWILTFSLACSVGYVWKAGFNTANERMAKLDWGLQFQKFTGGGIWKLNGEECYRVGGGGLLVPWEFDFAYE